MEPVTEPQVRASFINCSKGEAARIRVPRDLGTQPWDDLDLLGWRDPQSPGRAYLVAHHEGRLRGIVLRAPASTVGQAQRSMCSLCVTVRSGNVALQVAPRAGKAGKAGHTVGTYVCTDLSCSLQVRGKTASDGPRMHETLTVEQKVERLRGNLADFLRRVLKEG
ncbi:FBP domain-containing protein [Nocardioides zeae]|uniref:FBP domain-containing protein n=1 Tax=Nocardioides imazamoxiresistens TaxID=3231893 RepID=A0ABU3Q197_9ACTN|nr:FBP domain-containing protein [Nocardioides zeae]MDT9595255.1 FBP domain-containing protein [Nocardioides zeae]